MASDSPESLRSHSVPIPWRGSSLQVHVRRGQSATHPVVIFVNGLGRPMAAWGAVLQRLPTKYTLIAYDRFGQGVSAPLPGDVPEASRDAVAAARDLDELIRAVADQEKLDLTPPSSSSSPSRGIFLVAHSIGVGIARLFITNHSGIWVAGAVFLDPSPVNTDFVSLYPPPRDGEPADLTETREATRRVFHPSMPNPERFNRKNFAELLPLAERPTLAGDPYVTLVSHDPLCAFGEQSEKMGIKSKYALKYVEPYWRNYNQKLLLSVSPEKRKGPLKAEGADHFIQVCRPDTVAEEIVTLVTQATSQ
ncbi:Alpha/Beta hydrolase protein [Xylariales sp. PMI_506]|nr:Alpha/Beta hydrolase protein [Xylariales sp. PMI_506]